MNKIEALGIIQQLCELSKKSNFPLDQHLLIASAYSVIAKALEDPAKVACNENVEDGKDSKD